MHELYIKNIAMHDKNNITLFNNFSLHAKSANIVAILGSNGCGKSTLFKYMAGFNENGVGEIFLNSCNLRTISPAKRLKKLSFALQKTPFDHHINGYDRIEQGFYGKEKHDDDKIKNIANYFKIKHLLNKKIINMSVGEQRLIYLAKCLLIKNIPLFILDEPEASLDIEQKKRLANLLKKIAREGSIIILSSHDKYFVDSTCDMQIELKRF